MNVYKEASSYTYAAACTFLLHTSLLHGGGGEHTAACGEGGTMIEKPGVTISPSPPR